MMNLRNTLATSAAAAALMAGATAAHAGDYYVSLFGGLSTFDDEIPFAQSTYNSGFQKSGTPFSGIIGGGPVGTYTVHYTRLALHTTSYLFGTSKFQWEDDFDSGWVVGAAFGAQLSSGFSAELELAYRAADVSGGARIVNDFDGRNGYSGTGTLYIYDYNFIAGSVTNVHYSGIPFTGTFPPYPTYTSGNYFPFDYNLPLNSTVVGNASTDGDANVWSLMANLWYDFNFMGLNPEGFHTFVGGGIGVAQIDLEYNASANTLLGGTIGYSLDDSAMGFAYQLGGGVGFDLGGGMMLSAQYRWFGTSDVDLGNTDLRVESHNAMIGLQIPLGNLSM